MAEEEEGGQTVWSVLSEGRRLKKRLKRWTGSGEAVVKGRDLILSPWEKAVHMPGMSDREMRKAESCPKGAVTEWKRQINEQLHYNGKSTITEAGMQEQWR